jgi:small subunit ribosomal protein S1
MADMEADFRVIEFSKENRRIVVSHSRMWQEVKEGEKAAEQAEVANFKKSKKAKTDEERDTLGDLDALAGLKEQMLQTEKKAQAEAIKKMDAKAKKPSAKKAKSEDNEDEEA